VALARGGPGETAGKIVAAVTQEMSADAPDRVRAMASMHAGRFTDDENDDLVGARQTQSMDEKVLASLPDLSALETLAIREWVVASAQAGFENHAGISRDMPARIE
jgi:hypothetical protein